MRSDLFQEAKRRIDRRRMNQQLALSARLEEIREKTPEVIVVRRKLAMTSAEVSKLILQKSTDIAAGIARIEEVNLDLQAREKKLLQEGGYPEDYLEMRYDCPLCKDTGFVDGRRCRCLQEEMQRLAVEDLNRSSPLQASRFEDFDLSYYPDVVDPDTGRNPRVVMERYYRYCKQYADNFRPDSQGIFMYGNTGLGKTHLSLAIAGVVAAKGYSVAYGTAQDLLRRIENEHFGRAEDAGTLDTLLSSDLLVLDDLGAERSTEYAIEQLYAIVDQRYRSGKPLIVTTNMTLEQLKNGPELGRRRIYERVLEMCPYRCQFTGPNRRTKMEEDEKNG